MCKLVSATAFNWFIVAMLWSTATIFVIALGLMAYALVLRARATARRRRIRKLVNVWRARFIGALPSTSIAVRRRDVATVLDLWSEYASLRTDDARASTLQAIAVAHDFEGLALRLAGHRGPGARLVAMTALGTMRSRAALPLAEELVGDAYGQVSLAAWRAIVLIDPARIVGFVDAIGEHADWQARSVQQTLVEFGPEEISRPLALAVERASDEQVLRLGRYLIFAEPMVAREALRAVLTTRSDPEIVASSLRALAPIATAEDREVVCPMLANAVAFVRIAAIGALVRIAVPDDRAALLGLLADENSWVRYRAAQAVVDRFPEPDPRGEVADAYGRDALTQVMAERSASAAAEDFLGDDGTDEPLIERTMGRMRVEA